MIANLHQKYVVSLHKGVVVGGGLPPDDHFGLIKIQTYHAILSRERISYFGKDVQLDGTSGDIWRPHTHKKTFCCFIQIFLIAGKQSI